MSWSFMVLGGGQEIGANSYLLRIDGVQLLLDAGLHPKKYGAESLPEYDRIKGELEAIFISHAHLDHVGSLPIINQKQPQAPIFSTIPTKDIALRMLHNTVTVMNIFRAEKGFLEYPFFEHEDIRPLEGEVIGMEFKPLGITLRPGGRGLGERLRLRSHIQAYFIPSGHVLGAAGVFIQQGKRTLFYTGDIAMRDQGLIPGALIPESDIDTLILECTYANDPGYYSQIRQTEIENFAKAATGILSGGGSVLIPAFALGKTQELLHIIHSLMSQGQIPAVPLYISGLGKSIAEIYQDHFRYLRPQASKLSFDLFSVLGFLDENSIQDLLQSPCLIVATNGMMVENTPSARIAKRMIQEEKHGIFFCGYIDPDTLGYRVFHSTRGEALAFAPDEDPVVIGNPNVKRFYLSSHADRYELLALAKKLHPRTIILVHGEKEGMEFMRGELAKESQVFLGEKGKTIPLD
jgi:cleavage and polyadenylation specificity factor subunit 3